MVCYTIFNMGRVGCCSGLQVLDGVLKQADTAMYEAKATGRDMACFYSVQTDQRALARQSLEQHLRRALERNELSLHYQPRVRAQNGQLVGVEALMS